MQIDKIQIEAGWKEALKEEFLSENFARVKENFLRAKAAGEVYPPNALIFNAFNLTPFNAVKVVIFPTDTRARHWKAFQERVSVISQLKEEVRAGPGRKTTTTPMTSGKK